MNMRVMFYFLSVGNGGLDPVGPGVEVHVCTTAEVEHRTSTARPKIVQNVLVCVANPLTIALPVMWLCMKSVSITFLCLIWQST